MNVKQNKPSLTEDPFDINRSSYVKLSDHIEMVQRLEHTGYR